MCPETSGEATSVPPQVPPTRSPPPNSYRTCSTPTSESPLGCPLRTQTPRPSEAEAEWEGGRKRDSHTEKSKGSRAKEALSDPSQHKGFSPPSPPITHRCLIVPPPSSSSSSSSLFSSSSFRDGRPLLVSTTPTPSLLYKHSQILANQTFWTDFVPVVQN